MTFALKLIDLFAGAFLASVLGVELGWDESQVAVLSESVITVVFLGKRIRMLVSTALLARKAGRK